jgi:zinc transport system substrate-binding protein
MRIIVMKRTALLVPVAVAALLAGCGTGDTSPSGSDTLAVTASFYPLVWATERVGGDRVEVTSLTPPGAEPHDLELTPKQVGGLGEADVVVYAAGFQPAVDDAVETVAADAGFDVAPYAELTISATGEEHSHENGEEHADEHDTAAMDPHFWLDPVRFEEVVTAIGDRLAEADPAHAADYAAGAERLVGELEVLDEEFSTGLADCAQDHLVTSHTAFAYLAQRYGFEQVGIAGVNPDVEPDAASLKEISELVEAEGVTTIYTETLASPALAETVARETGATTAVLDPVAGLTDTSAGTDYLGVMRSNLATLETGQECR